jgi:signal transduction histidine kinase
LIRPFKKIQNFARHIAAGNLDIPLEMDKNNIFGAFTAGFDIMRDELRRARENEREADRQKKELVASISHDIKTPVASIKSATELMLLTIDNREYREQLEGINAKAEQINSLVTDMFHSALEELQALSVSATEIESAAIMDLIRKADYEKRVKPIKVPNCLISADPVRLGQVFDNIISNSYKYAGTGIDVHAFFENQYLAVDIIDYGAGVQEDELPLLTNKFYRGQDAAAKNGYGLGLYICRYLMNQMSGGLRCENRSGGFCVRLMLRMAS